MVENSARRALIRKAITASIVAVVLLAVAISGIWWFPHLRDAISAMADRGAQADEAEKDAHAEQDPDVLELSAQARDSMQIDIQPLLRATRDRALRIPGQIDEVPGVTHQDISATSTGMISAVHVREGQVVTPGSALFSIRLVHEESINLQLALLDALAQLEVVGAEIARLEQLERERPGGILLKDLRKVRYERAQLQHTIGSRRHALVLLGLSESEVDAFIKNHREHDPSGEDPAQHEPHEETHPLLENLEILAPSVMSGGGAEAAMYIVENLEVKPGQHVEVGTLLCRLGNYQELYIEGRAFERDMSIVRHAMSAGWKTTAIIERHGANIKQEDLEILYIDPAIDPRTRSARFFITLDNVLESRREVDGRTFVDWTYRPGQQIELHVPVERFTKRLIVPVEAVARDGLRRYVFQVSGNLFVRREVTVEYQDEQFVVLSDKNKNLEGASLAMTGAFQLQLALLNRRGGQSQDAHHGHGH